MHPRLLDYYNRELAHLRDMGAEFAHEFPKVAGRLGMEGLEVSDPYVERLMEGFAFVAARVQLKLDAEFPRFTQHLLEMVYPHFLAPTPSFGIVAMKPNFSDNALAAGVTVPRGSSMRSVVPRGQQTACEFRSVQPVTLYPVELTQASYFAHAADLPLAAARTPLPVRSGLRLRLQCHGGLHFDRIDCDALNVHINAADDLAVPLYEMIFAQCIGVMVVQEGRLIGTLDRDHVEGMGFDDDEALLPFGKRSFQGYRLLQEYFAFPQRFLFFNLRGLAPLLRKAAGDQIELVLLFGRHEARLDGALEAAHFNLYATPVANLFERRADRVAVGEGEFEHHLVIDRTRPLDYEIFSVSRLRGFGTGDAAEMEFKPFYASMDNAGSPHHAYYTLRREPRRSSSRQQQAGARSSYVGTEIFVGLVDTHEAPYPDTIRQLGADVWATNRDLPLLLPVAAQNPLLLDASAPVSRITMVHGPTRPRSAVPEGDYAWRLVHHLSLNYLSLIDRPGSEDGAATLRGLLELYSAPANPGMQKQIDALQAVTSRTTIRRLPIPGPIAFGRGIEIDLRIDESRLPGSGGFLLGTILDRFFAQHVSINAFTQTRLLSDSRAEVYRWPPRIGRKTLA
ncbi:type VI secretion system baseplate subunit TssF [Noviherbaspirillum sp.]|uniref:type VI secretion system baseplate subunit TssF n=1 Tax=Noviherbaspirillum sp. TaxID=1926288 RepID=UPI002FDF650A